MLKNKASPPNPLQRTAQTLSLASGCLGRQGHPVKSMAPRVSCLTLTPSLHLSGWLAWAGPYICPSLALGLGSNNPTHRMVVRIQSDAQQGKRRVPLQAQQLGEAVGQGRHLL